MNQIPNIEETHNTREVEEGVDAVFQAVMSDLKEKYRVSDTLYDVLSDSLSKHLTEAITTLFQEVDHQLQKAREEEKQRCADVFTDKVLDLRDENGEPLPREIKLNAVLQALDHSELDQEVIS